MIEATVVQFLNKIRQLLSVDNQHQKERIKGDALLKFFTSPVDIGDVKNLNSADWQLFYFGKLK